MIDANGSPCRCGSTLRTYSFPRTRGQTEGVRGCVRCRERNVVDCAFNVPLVLRTVEQVREWWDKLDNRPA